MEQKPRQLNQEQERQTAISQTARPQTRQFESPEDAIRSDRDQIHSPPHLEERVAQLVNHTPQTRQPWWKRLFGQK
jgi:hypothetical protein